MFHSEVAALAAAAGVTTAAVVAGIAPAQAAPETKPAAAAAREDLASPAQKPAFTRLVDNVTLHQKTPAPGGRNYELTTTKSYWSVLAFEGSGPYDIQLGEGQIAPVGVETVPMTGSAVATVRDVYLEAGVNYAFSLEPLSPAMNGSLYLMSSHAGSSSSWVQSETQAVAKTYGVTGAWTALQYKPWVSDWYGLVIVSEGADGDFELSHWPY